MRRSFLVCGHLRLLLCDSGIWKLLFLEQRFVELRVGGLVGNYGHSEPMDVHVCIRRSRG